jgi:hypothetical protein
MLPPGPVDLAAGPAEHRVIDRHAQPVARPGQQHHRQLRDRQPELVKLPAGAGEEVVRPVMRPGVLQGTAQQHAHHGPAADLARQPGDQPAERREPRRGETRPQPAQQARQRSG